MKEIEEHTKELCSWLEELILLKCPKQFMDSM
jgi:hypothetical protein